MPAEHTLRALEGANRVRLFAQVENSLRGLEAVNRAALCVQQIGNTLRGLEAINRLALFTQPAFAQQVENILRALEAADKESRLFTEGTAQMGRYGWTIPMVATLADLRRILNAVQMRRLRTLLLWTSTLKMGVRHFGN